MFGRVTLLLILLLAGLIAATLALAALQSDLLEQETPAMGPVGSGVLRHPEEADDPAARPASGFELETPAPAVSAEGEDAATEAEAEAEAEAAIEEAAPTTAPAPIEEARQVVDEILDYQRWIVWSQRALLIAIVIVIALIVIRIGRRILLNVQESRRLPDTVMLPIRRTLRGLILLAALLLSLQFMGLSMDYIWASLVGILALIGAGFIAVWSVLSNMACSFLLMMFKPFRIGDVVEIVDSAAGPNVGGRVTDLTLMYTVLREETDEGPAFIQIPNNLFFQRVIRRRAGKRAVPIEQHIEKHGLTGREQKPPPQE